MPLHPDAQTYLNLRLAHGEQPLPALTVAEAREQLLKMSQLTVINAPVVQSKDQFIPGPGEDIPIRIYTPAGDGPWPMLLYFHGGGWVLGSLESVDSYCRIICRAVPCLVISVNYRHAPEHKFPAAAEDCYAATVWAAAHGAALNGDPTRLAVGGSSAGGNLAAVTCLMAKANGGPAITFQLLSVPVTHYSYDSHSYQENREGYGLTRANMEWFWDHYLNQPEDGQHPYASPLLAGDLSGLPPAFVLTAEFDPLRDEGEAYSERLRQAGVPVTATRYAGMIHSFLGEQAHNDSITQLQKAFVPDQKDAHH